MNLSTYIIDDEYHAIALLSDYIHRTPGLTLSGTSTDPLAGLEQLSASPPAITFLDIQMQGISGMEMAGLIGHLTSIVFTTSYRKFAVDAFQKNALDYLLKPFSYERFLQCIQKARDAYVLKNNQTVKEPDHFYVKSGIKGKLIKIVFSDIFCIEGAQNYVRIILRDKTVTTHATIQHILRQLPPADFIRTHKCFIVNQNRISAIEPGQLKLGGQHTVPLGRAYRSQFFQNMNHTILRDKGDQKT
jgi:two-component system LytT family response regulator